MFSKYGISKAQMIETLLNFKKLIRQSFNNLSWGMVLKVTYTNKFFIRKN